MDDGTHRRTTTDTRERLARALAGRYAVADLLGRGGTSLVFAADDHKLGRAVAIKVLRPEQAALLGPERFLREVRIAAQLSHPNILPLFDSGDADGLPWFSMPLLAGETLRARLQREGPLPVADAIAIARDIASALGYAHARGIIHRDIKPENILLEGGRAIVADFGIARALSAASTSAHSSDGFAVGTPFYMAPEQAMGSADLDPRCDLYALGCVLFELLAGRPPFPGGTVQEVLARQLTAEAPLLRTLRADVPGELEGAVARLLLKPREARYQSADELDRVLAGTVPSGWAPARKPRRWGWVVAGVGAVVAGLAWWLLTRPPAVPLDPQRFVVLPFVHRGAMPATLTGDQCEALVRDALALWSDVRVVDPFTLQDALQRDPSLATPSLASGTALARRLGAGMLVLGEVSSIGDSARVRAVLYGVGARGGELRSAVTRVALTGDGAAVARGFEALADELLRGSGGTRAGRVGLATTSFRAWRAYDSAMTAVARWELDRAREGFAEAQRRDPGFALATLQLAQLGQWTRAPAAEWRPAVLSALGRADRLPRADSVRAMALAALGAGQPEQACAAYRALLQRDAGDFVSWLGLGDCLVADDAVVASAASSTGFVFRASLREAAAAYRRASTLVPSLHRVFREVAAARLAGALYTQPHQYRTGRMAGDTAMRFGAFPAWGGDTVRFAPRRIAELLSGRDVADPRALAAMRGVLDEVAGAWVREFPRSAEARRARGLALELAGPPDGGGPWLAGVAYDSAAILAASPVRRAEALVDRLRFALKEGDAKRLGRLLDSLSALPAASPPLPQAQFVAALLRGDTTRALVLAEAVQSDLVLNDLDGTTVPAPLSVRLAALRLQVIACSGGGPAAVRLRVAALDSAINVSASGPARAAQRSAALMVPWFCAGPAGARGEVPWPFASRFRDFERLPALSQAAVEGKLPAGTMYRVVSAMLADGDTAAATTALQKWLRLPGGERVDGLAAVQDLGAIRPSLSQVVVTLGPTVPFGLARAAAGSVAAMLRARGDSAQ
ncbi:MAG: protein kinase [Gemmatimonadales bacterium]|nr:protein kinase [Gemmatimonadales bacterium]